ncbi:MAG TPA: TlpA family protein disulfide reductase [Bacteroidetes bacterium]|nr:TlpA family protein disulfide reductase [Bacteroidota bacterium]
MASKNNLSKYSKCLKIIPIIVCCGFCACHIERSENTALPSDDKKEKKYANDIEKIIEENGILKINLVKPFGRSEVTEQYDLTKQNILFGRRAIAIDSIFFYLKSIVDIKINNKEHLLTLISDDGATNYQRLGQDDLDRMDKRPDEPYYVYKNILLLNNPLVNKMAPPIIRTTLSGKKFNLENLKGKVVYIDFWYLRCTVCYQEIGELNKLKKEFPEVEFISIMPEKKEVVGKRIHRTKDGLFKLDKRHTVYSDHIASDIIIDGQSIIDEYKVYSFPTNFLIGKDGKVKFVTSFSRYKYLEESRFLLNELLEGN